MAPHNFDEAVNAVLHKIKVEEDDHKIFLDHVDTITNEIYTFLEKKYSIFKDMFKGLKHTAFYVQKNVLDMPLNFDEWLLFELPFPVETLFDDNDDKIVRLKTGVIHPVVKDGYVNVDIFKFLFEGNIEIMVEKIKPITCSDGKTYKLSFNICEHINGQNLYIIKAKEEVEIGTAEIISFHFSIALKFRMNEKPLPEDVKVPNFLTKFDNWLAVPKQGNVWVVYITLWQLVDKIADKQKYKDANLLLFLICQKADLLKENLRVTPWINNYATYVFLQSTENSTALVFMQMYEILLRILDLPTLIFLDLEIKLMLIKLSEIFRKLKFYQLMDVVNFDDFLEIFGLV